MEHLESLQSHDGKTPEQVRKTAKEGVRHLADSIIDREEDLKSRVDSLAGDTMERVGALGEKGGEKITALFTAFMKAVQHAFEALGFSFDKSDLLAHTDVRDEEPEAPANVDIKKPLPEILGRQNLEAHVEEAESLYRVPATLIATVIRMESGFDPNICNGSHCGLGQLGKAERLAFVASSECPPDIKMHFDWKNPRHNILATAWLLKEKREEVNALIDKDQKKGGSKKFREEYRFAANDSMKITAEDAKLWWRAYHDGAGGYLKWRRYEDDQSEDNWNNLSYFQKDVVWLARTKRYSEKLALQFETYAVQAAS